MLLKNFLFSQTLMSNGPLLCSALGGEDPALPPPEGEAGVHPAAGSGVAAVLRERGVV